MRGLVICMSVLATIGASDVNAQDERLPARVQREGNIELVRTVAYEPLTLKELVKRSSFVARVLVLRNSTRLSDDETLVVTDSDVQALEVFRNVLGIKATPVIAVRQPGGSMLVAGRQVSVRESDFPPLELGQEYVLFLYRERNSDRLSVMGGPQGVFEVTGGQLSHVVKSRPLWETDGESALSIDKSEFVRMLQGAVSEIEK
jgi:hypothetical protein